MQRSTCTLPDALFALKPVLDLRLLIQIIFLFLESHGLKNYNAHRALQTANVLLRLFHESDVSSYCVVAVWSF